MKATRKEKGGSPCIRDSKRHAHTIVPIDRTPAVGNIRGPRATREQSSWAASVDGRSRSQVGCVALLFTLLLVSCGSDLPCSRYDSEALPHEREMADEIATLFVDYGFPEPCCPIHHCRLDEKWCQDRIRWGGTIHFEGDQCTEILISPERAEANCGGVDRVIIHEWLHEVKYTHGEPESKGLEDRLVDAYRDRGASDR